ncbi:MAG TPA: xanthine dehydrogenase family protein subunit M [Thermoanaerobaculaceae bacterium]|nr:xanthine dehydrogenase family protein subunit M [Thermoanaerobaculaceae bacterium]HRS16388.1 xanthine dehydrogenase family protein subunit M [Thermoanaerobaculaceae bacterium]
MLQAFAYARPSTLAEAVRLAGRDGARLHAGGTDLLGCLRDHVLAAETVVSLSSLADLRGIAPARDGGLRIGALATIAEVAAHPVIRERYAALAEAASQVASPQLRNQGTLGGNLCQKPRCWYYRGDFHCLRKGGEMCYAAEGENQAHALFGAERCFYVHPSDTAPALVALGASVRLVGPAGPRALLLDRFFVPPSTDPQRETVLEPGEILTDVVLPPPGAGLRSSYRKVRARAVWDFALAGVALAARMEGDVVREARVVLSGVAPVPWRHPGAEAALAGKPLDATTIAAAARAATAGAEPLAHNAYKVELLRGLLTDELERLARR